ncbi:MAG TPA: branched-chain amino acid ABC transporter ATP-binding protein/permease [Aliidongia sp.]|nr:branched-chain amino acid ABC transporter ATP-binding protein/permease [Aliidongia sp.]
MIARLGLAALAILSLLLALGVGLNPYELNILVQAATYAIAVLGLVIVLGLTGQISLAQAGFFGLGAYGVALGTTIYHLPFLVSLVAGMVIAALMGAALGASTLRLGGHYLAMVTISFQQILTLVLTNWISVTRGPDGIRDIPRPILFGVSFAESGRYLAFCLVLLYLAIYAIWRLKQTRLGLGMQAVRDNELAAEVVGVNTYVTKVIAFILSAALGGLGGGLFAGGFGFISPDQFSFAESVVFMTMALLGGVQSPFGAALGTFILILMPEWLRFLKVFYLAIYGLAVILIVRFMPNGIWGYVEGLRRRQAPAPIGPVEPLELLSSRDVKGGTLLEVQDLAKHFGGLKAVDGVDLSIERGTCQALIGPNGSGKTTLLNVLSGIYKPTRGAIRYKGENVAGMSPHMLAARGVGRTFQNIRLFGSLTALENVVIGALRPGHDVPGGMAGVRARALAALDFVGMLDQAELIVSGLPYGYQRRIEIARALAGNPGLLLLDEPGAGLNLTEKQGLVELLRRLKGHGMTIFLIDHDMNLVEQVAECITVLNFGRKIAEGTPREVLRHPEVRKAYLGEETDADAA